MPCRHSAAEMENTDQTPVDHPSHLWRSMLRPPPHCGGVGEIMPLEEPLTRLVRCQSESKRACEYSCLPNRDLPLGNGSGKAARRGGLSSCGAF